MESIRVSLSRLLVRGAVVGAGFLCVCVAVVSVMRGPGAVLTIADVLFVRTVGAATVDDRLEEVGAKASERLRPHFEEAGVSYPPAKVVMVGLKGERRLEVYAAEADGEFSFIREYPVLAASGSLGPKLRQGDRQVPEGVYTIDALNPNSSFHLSLRINYPNAFDRAKAAQEGRSDPGDDIFIHGDAVSIGCLAMGDRAAEDLFVLAALTGVEDVDIILAPVDFRRSELPDGVLDELPEWMDEVYGEVRAELEGLKHEGG